MKNNNIYYVLGLMSGTSLDGLDLAYCKFYKEPDGWHFNLLDSNTVAYHNTLKDELKRAMELTGLELLQLDVKLADFFSKCINDFRKDDPIDFIASHGHTIFHQPQKKLTLQIGNGIVMNELTDLPVIYNYRMLDVQRGGQGAPLVPIADKLLFNDYDYCLNLGGIANMSFEEENGRIAFDISPCNLLLNHLAMRAGFDYDSGGMMASRGMVVQELLEKWNNFSYYSLAFPKSMGYEMIKDNYLSDLDLDQYVLNDLQASCVEHIAFQISQQFDDGSNQSLFVTGGGVKNSFLISRLKYYLPQNIELIIPSNDIIDYKEAIAFGFLGVLKLRGEINILSSVTGASKDSSAGIMIGF